MRSVRCAKAFALFLLLWMGVNSAVCIWPCFWTGSSKQWFVYLDTSRSLLQNEILEIIVETEDELMKETSRVGPGGSIFINAAALELNQPVYLNTSNFTIRGRGMNKTRIRCSLNGRGNPAFIINGNEKSIEVKMKSLTVSECVNGSAVVVESNRGGRNQSLEVMFDGVRFSRNGALYTSSVLGGGVKIDTCLHAKCTRPRLKITDCIFEENRGHQGGAIYGRNCELRISESTFVSNEALLTGGAIHLDERSPVLEMQSCALISNSATVGNSSSPPDSPFTSRGGGALFIGTPLRLIVMDSELTDNIADTTGGAIFVKNEDSSTLLESSVTVLIKNSTFSKNSIDLSGISDYERQRITGDLQNSGGALFFISKSILSVDISVRNSTFRHNSAAIGGAVVFLATPEVTHYLHSCVLTNNEADITGGGVLVGTSKLVVNGTYFSENRARVGGAVYIRWDAELIAGPELETGKRTVFEYNRALYGAGTHIHWRSAVTLEAVDYRNNIAMRSGGAIRGYDTSHPFVIRGVQFVNNTALIAGAISLKAVANLEIDAFNGVPTRIVGNTAAVAGGLERHPGTFLHESIYIRNTEFHNNRAANLSDPIILAAQRRILEDPYFSGVLREIARAFPGEYTLEHAFRQMTALDEGFGGGFMIETDDLTAFVIAEIVFMNVTMTGNEARVGGGGYFSGYTAFWNRESRLSCFPAAYGVDSCQKLLFQNVTITENQAQYAGGLFVSKPGTVMLTCDRSVVGENKTLVEVMQGQVQREDSDFINSSYCTEIHSNWISDGTGEGADVGSSAASLHLVNSTNRTLKTVASGETLTFPCEDSVDVQCPRNVTIEIKDSFNQTISRGIKDANLDLTLSSPSVSGDLRYTATNGILRINNTNAWGINVSSAELRIQATTDSSMEVIASFSTRPCIIGEHVHDFLCIPCPPDQYSFNPLQHSCAPCEAHAICKGRAALVPTDGYWHSTPFSTQFHPCLYPEACTYDNRSELLTQFYDDITPLQDLLKQLESYIRREGALPDFASYKQCSDGYEGVLCGSCAEGYGHSLTGECEECPENKRDSIIIGVIFFIWTFLIIGVNASITLLSAGTRILLVQEEQNKIRSSSKKPILTRSIGHASGRYNPRPSVPPQPCSSQISEGDELQDQRLFHESLVATVQITEVLKILLNYLQVTSTALRLQVEWGSTMNGLLSTEGAVAGISSNALNVPSECHFEGDSIQHPAIAALWMRILTPSGVLCSLVFVFSVAWFFVRGPFKRKKRSSWQSSSALGSWKTGVIVITIVAVYFSFIDVVRELLRTVNCIDVDGTSDSGALYGEYAIATGGKVWVEDTNLRCFGGAHIGTGIAGIFGLVLSIFIIVFIVVWLPFNRSHQNEPHFIARYWFLYQAYRREWYTYGWEAVILTRKALMAAVVVFAINLGQTLQATLCLGILLLALMIQTIFRPFKVDTEATNVPEYFGEFFNFIRLPQLVPKWLKFSNSLNLNSLECGSLFASIAIFLLAVVLNDPHSSRYGQAMMITIAFMLNVLYLMFMFYRLYAGVHLVLDLKLEMMDPAFMATNPNGPGLFTLFRKGYQIASSVCKRQENQDRETSVTTEKSLQTSMSNPAEALKETELASSREECNV